MKTKISIVVTILVLTIITSYSVRGTYAKYSTSIDASDDARVAKWGFNMSKTIDLFANSSYTTKIDGKNVIAPGTSGEYKFSIVGAPETSYRLEVFVSQADDTIRRIKYKFDNYPETDSIEDIADQIEQSYNSDIVYGPNVAADFDPATGKQKEHTLSWRWIFSEGDTIDVIDTDKGKRAVIHQNESGFETQPSVTLKIDILAEQVD